MSITKNVLLNWYSLMKKNWERFGWFLTKKIGFESQIFALFDSSPFIQNSKFNTFLWVCWFLCKNIFLVLYPPAWKLRNLYWHSDNTTMGPKIIYEVTLEILGQGSCFYHHQNFGQNSDWNYWRSLLASAPRKKIPSEKVQQN